MPAVSKTIVVSSALATVATAAAGAYLHTCAPYVSGLLSNAAVGFAFVALGAGVIDVLHRRWQEHAWLEASAQFDERVYRLAADCIIHLTELSGVTSVLMLQIVLDSTRTRATRQPVLLCNARELAAGRVLPQAPDQPLSPDSEEKLRRFASAAAALRDDAALLAALGGRSIAPALHAKLLELHDLLGAASHLLAFQSTLTVRFQAGHADIKNCLMRLASLSSDLIEHHTKAP
ncbi:MAG: hypothetical protein IPP07_30515 [Holophagales bacterium]|nr:hypothetical protein [Holophagales bacterium]